MPIVYLVYLREKYQHMLEPRFLHELNSLRLERHEILYSLENLEVTKEEAEHMIALAKDFISAIEAMLK